ncbi:hypothetical protein ACROYT_G004738 [Oculina patagonica]
MPFSGLKQAKISPRSRSHERSQNRSCLPPKGNSTHGNRGWERDRLSTSFDSGPSYKIFEVSANATQQSQCEKSTLKECGNGRDGRDGRDGQNGLPGKDGRDGRDGRNGVKGDKGDTVFSGGNGGENGAKKALELCDGSTWFRLVTARKGHVDSNPGRHCLDILDSGQSRGSGLYWIDPNGGSTDDSFQAFCDMDTESGGWTLIATKVSPNVLFIKTSFSTMAAKTKYADAASHIHLDMRDWEEAMFRFADVNTIRVIDNRKAGAPQNGKTGFEKFLMGTYANMGKNEYGFFKYSPADKNQRNPAVGFATISPFYFRSKEGISELHAGTDKWLDMWYTADPTNNYVTSDDSKARGTKCIAGYCYLNKPIWVMVSVNGTQQNQCGKTSIKECCNCRDGRDGRDGQNGLQGKDGRDGRDGKNGLKGKKGEPGSSSNPFHGAIKFSYTADTCSLHTAGTVRYSSSQNALQLCDGSVWLSVLTAGKGHVASNPGSHCLDILNSGQSRGSGLYWIDPNSGSTDDSFQAFCDMETERGGWTLVATKVSPSFCFIAIKFSTMAAKSKYADAASHIHPAMGDWEEVLFRFADVNNIRAIYNRKAGAPQNDKSDFDEFLMGKSASMDKKVYGFYKYSPADHNKRTPAVGFATISRLAIQSDYGISEWHYGTDKWIDMWTTLDSRNNYVTSDDNMAVGTKCIAGFCYLNKPIWVMVR